MDGDLRLIFAALILLSAASMAWTSGQFAESGNYRRSHLVAWISAVMTFAGCSMAVAFAEMATPG